MDSDFFRKNGAKGGRNGHTGGFAANPELARIAGAKGGKKSRRGRAKRKPVSTRKVSVRMERDTPVLIKVCFDGSVEQYGEIF